MSNNVQCELLDNNPWPGPFRGAYRKGVEARLRGGHRGCNPYTESRTYRGGVTFWAFQKAWDEGWLDADKSIGEKTQ